MYGTICAMSTAYELNGRTNQKRRTRDALVAAARSIVAEGRTPTVEEVAETASISRTTAYRYFPSQRALLAAAHPETAVESLLPDDPPEDVAATARHRCCGIHADHPRERVAAAHHAPTLTRS